MGPALDPMQHHAQHCLACGRCVRECAFLQHHGDPKAQALAWVEKPCPQVPFACTLCGLCGAVCPVQLQPQEMFFAMRQQMVQAGVAPFPEHRRLLRYEALGKSSCFTSFALPQHCDTILFPGCAFAGTRPERLLELYHWLQQRLPRLGLILACCGKPSHDLGLAFSLLPLLEHIRRQGIQRVLVLCPSCYTIFAKYAPEIQLAFAFEALDGMPPKGRLEGVQVTVHDPCTLRQEQRVHAQVRSLLQGLGLEIVEMPHRGEKTLCCGEGGGAALMAPAWAKGWGKRRGLEAGTLAVVAYCAGCVASLAPQMQAIHLLDILFAPEASVQGKVKPTQAPWTYLKRLLLKHRVQRKAFCSGSFPR